MLSSYAPTDDSVWRSIFDAIRVLAYRKTTAFQSVYVERKFDGIRCRVTVVDANTVEIKTKQLNSIRNEPIAKEILRVTRDAPKPFVLDCEFCSLAEGDPQKAKNILRGNRGAYYVAVFDVLWWRDRYLCFQPLEDRKRALISIEETLPTDQAVFQFVTEQHPRRCVVANVDDDERVAAFVRANRAREGFVLKSASSLYTHECALCKNPKRDPNWVKFKAEHTKCFMTLAAVTKGEDGKRIIKLMETRIGAYYPMDVLYNRHVVNRVERKLRERESVQVMVQFDIRPRSTDEEETDDEDAENEGYDGSRAYGLRSVRVKQVTEGTVESPVTFRVLHGLCTNNALIEAAYLGDWDVVRTILTGAYSKRVLDYMFPNNEALTA